MALRDGYVLDQADGRGMLHQASGALREGYDNILGTARGN